MNDALIRLAGIQVKDCVASFAGRESAIEVVQADAVQTAAMQVHRGLQGSPGKDAAPPAFMDFDALVATNLLI